MSKSTVSSHSYRFYTVPHAKGWRIEGKRDASEGKGTSYEKRQPLPLSQAMLTQHCEVMGSIWAPHGKLALQCSDLGLSYPSTGEKYSKKLNSVPGIESFLINSIVQIESSSTWEWEKSGPYKLYYYITLTQMICPWLSPCLVCVWKALCSVPPVYSRECACT